MRAQLMRWPSEPHLIVIRDFNEDTTDALLTFFHSGALKRKITDINIKLLELARMAVFFAVDDLLFASLTILACETKSRGLSKEQLEKVGCPLSTMVPIFHVKILKTIGYTLDDLLEAQVRLPMLLPTFTWPDLSQAGLTVKKLLQHNVSIKALKASGVSARQFVNADCTRQDLQQTWSMTELRDAGIEYYEMRELGYLPKRLMSDSVGYPKDSELRYGKQNTEHVKKKPRLPEDAADDWL
jgi:hypothetical protein